jgi:hypothetical protein
VSGRPQEGIGTIITAIARSRMIFRRLETYILYRVASSLTILGFFFFAIIILRLLLQSLQWVVRTPLHSLSQLVGAVCWLRTRVVARHLCESTPP